MMKSQVSLEQGQSEKSNIDFTALQNKIFTIAKDGKILIGGIVVTEQMRSILRDEAENFKTTHLYEILTATVDGEAINLLLQAGTLEHLQYGKALNYWNKIARKVVEGLSKKL